MPNVRTLQRSFAGGEMSPEMFGRIDDVKYQTGAAKLRNFIASPTGPAENRPGLQYVNEVKTSGKKTRLIPFTYSTTQTVVLEFGEQYIRFYTQGAPILAGTGTPYQASKTVTSISTATDTVTSTAHGYTNGTPVRFSATGVLPNPLLANVT